MSPASKAREPRSSISTSNSEKRGILAGCAGWTIPVSAASHFPLAGSHLERYAAVLPAVEINSSFYRSHRPETYARWAASVPADFRFTVKAPKIITHLLKLSGTTQALESFLSEVASLGSKLGCLLFQLPPSLACDTKGARIFFRELRNRFDGTVAFEPRHASWFDAKADALLRDLHVARVAADPPVVPSAANPGGWTGAVYHRLHGSPKMYYSAYPEDYLRRLAELLRSEASTAAAVWCMFDNTAGGMAMSDALSLIRQLPDSSGQSTGLTRSEKSAGGKKSAVQLSKPVAASQSYLVQLSLPLVNGAGKAFPQELFREVERDLTAQFSDTAVFTRAPLAVPSKGNSTVTPAEASITYEVTIQQVDQEWWREYRRVLHKRFREHPIDVKLGSMNALAQPERS